MNKTVKERIRLLREEMVKAGIDYYLVPTADCHSSEYISDHYKYREYITGFTGSAGTAVVTKDRVCLWTDGRYFVQAEKEIYGNEILLFKMGMPGVPKVSDYLFSQMNPGEVLGFDGMCLDASIGIDIENRFKKKLLLIKYDVNLIDKIWMHQPAIEYKPVHILPDNLSGESIDKKLDRLRKDMSAFGVKAYFLSKLDDIAWLFNIRGEDIPNNPVCFAYAYITLEKCVLFLNSESLHTALIDTLKSFGVEIYDYKKVFDYVKYNLSTPGNNTGCIMYDEKAVSYQFHKLFQWYGNCFSAQNPTTRYKSIKNEVELENIRKTYIKDSVALTKFLYKLKNVYNIEEYDEYTMAKLLDEERLSLDECRDLSFETISAYGPNAAMVHYSVDKKEAADLKPKGLYLLDSGGQYIGGTTDVTRTVALGPVTDEERCGYTLTLIAMLRLANTKFMHGCSGINLDIKAREVFWERGLDFKHGTGHGIGYMLNVHEGPQRLASKHVDSLPPAIFETGMIISDEPGIYVTDKYGVRIENILEVRDYLETAEGKFLQFRYLTLVPIDLDPIDISLLEPKDKKYLNEYHSLVKETLRPYLTDVENQWLETACRDL